MTDSQIVIAEIIGPSIYETQVAAS